MGYHYGLLGTAMNNGLPLRVTVYHYESRGTIMDNGVPPIVTGTTMGDRVRLWVMGYHYGQCGTTTGNWVELSQSPVGKHVHLTASAALSMRQGG